MRSPTGKGGDCGVFHWRFTLQLPGLCTRCTHAQTVRRSGLFGFRATGPLTFSLSPLAVGLDYFAVDNVRYQGKDVAIRWDSTGRKYGEAGFVVLQDGKIVASAPTLQPLNVTLQ